MKLYCVIDDIRYEIVSGATFSEEYNETLDSGTITLDQVEKIENLEPFDDVYIYDEETNGNKFYKHMLIDSFQEELNNLNIVPKLLYKYKIQLFSETKRLEKVVLPNISITQPVNKNRRRSVWDYLNVYLDLYSPKLKIKTGQNSWEYQKKYIFSDYHNLPDEYEEVTYLKSTGTQWIRTNIHIEQNDRLIIELKDFGLDGYAFGQNDYTSYFQMRCPDIIYTQNVSFIEHKTGDMWDFVFTQVPQVFNAHLGLFCVTGNGNPMGGSEGTIGSGKIYYLKYYHDGILTAHLIPCKRKSDGVLGFYDLEGNHTFYTNMGTGTFEYEAKRKPEHFNYNSVHDLFSTVDAPEMSLTNPTLRDVISQLMLTKDCIPVVHDDVIDFLDISKRNDTFILNRECVNYIHSGMTSEEFSMEARREYSGALSQENTCKMVEYLGFRNSNSSLLTVENLVLETRFPIYKVNKLYLCYYRAVQIKEGENETTNYYMCKQDITDLVLQNVVRQAMSNDYLEFEREIGSILTTKDLSKYRIGTVGYDIGSNQITGWGEKYEFYPVSSGGWFKREQTILQNIICFMDTRYIFGIKGVNNAVGPHQIVFGNPATGIDAIVTDGVYTNSSNSQKAIFFQIEYDAMFNGAIVHSKDYKNKDDLQTVDNCSSSLTVLEADGLFEKEKMNRLGNRQYNIQARYVGTNAYEIMNGSTCNHVLGSVLKYSNQDDDVVIYHKEYQIYENIILANYTGTFDYVLKNYFTSVYAKLRTYNLASYGESVVRAENYKEYVVLSEEAATFEKNTILYPHIDKYISCFDVTPEPDVINNENHNKQINFAYIQSKINGSSDKIRNSRSFSDVNVFASGCSLCVNLKMYDNVTNGVYIDDPIVKANEDDTLKIGSVQDWSIAVDDADDPFQKNMLFGFGHFYQEGDIVKAGKSIAIPEQWFQGIDKISSLYNQKILKLPMFEHQLNYAANNYLENNVDYYISSGANTNYIIYKDNKEVIDFTFQFETITNSKNIFFSSYFVKLNDMSGVYSKWKRTTDIINANSQGLLTSAVLKYEDVHTQPVEDYYQSVIKIIIGIPLETVLDDFPLEISPRIESPVIAVPTELNQYSLNSYTPYEILNYDSNNDSLNLNVMYYTAITHRWFGRWGRVWAPGHTTEQLDFNYDYSDDNYKYYSYVFKVSAVTGGLDRNWLYSNQSNFATFFFDIFSRNDEKYQEVQHISKNMFAIVSSEPIKKEVIYDTYLTGFHNLVIEKNKQYNFQKLAYGGKYEEWELRLNFTDSDGGWLDGRNQRHPFEGIRINLEGVYFVCQWDNGQGSIYQEIAYREQGSGVSDFEKDSFSKLTFTGGSDFLSLAFKTWFSDCMDFNQITASGVIIPNLPSTMKIVNTDDEALNFTSDTYISFDDLFKFENNSLPVIKVGNNALSDYIGSEEGLNKICSIQFWYLDNKNNVYNGQKDYGPGRLQFVFGVNVDEGQYEKDVYVSVATKRSPYIYSDDHKHIIGSVKQMTSLDYEQNNVMTPHQDIAPTIAIKDDTLIISTVSSVSNSYDVYVNDIFRQNITTTTFDLSSLNLSLGTHTVKVKAKNSIGLNDSNFSNVVDYVSEEHIRVTDLTNTIWRFNDTISLFSGRQINLSFECDSTEYVYMSSVWQSLEKRLLNYFSNSSINVYDSSEDGWSDIKYKTIHITGPTSQNLNDTQNSEIIDWLYDNATLIYN